MTGPGYLFRRSAAGILDVSGRDREAFLQGLCTNDVKALAPGASLWAAALSPVGKVLFPFRVSKREDRFRLLLSPDLVAAAAAHFRKYAVFQDVRVEESPSPFERFDFYGGTSPAPAEAEAWPAFFELNESWVVPAAAADAVERDLSLRGRPIGELDAEAWRIEAGRPREGFEIDAMRTPDEAGLADAISTTKGCYVGQEVVARLRTYGRLPRRLVRIRFSGGVPPSVPCALRRAAAPDLDAGLVTSAAVSPRTGAVGLGYVLRDVEDHEPLHVAGDPDGSARVEGIARG